MDKLTWYLGALQSLGLPSLVRFQAQKLGRPGLRKFTSKELKFPVFARSGSSDTMVFHQIFIEREYRCLDGLKDPHFIVDCGANVGYSSAYFLSRFPNARLVAVEPDTGNFSLLKSNLVPYGERVKLFEAAVWPRNERITFSPAYAGSGQEWARRVEKTEDGTVQAINIPELMRLSGFPRISILKIDIEGAEEELFKGPIEWLELVDNLVIELHGESCSKAFSAAIEKRQWTVSTCGELTVCLP